MLCLYLQHWAVFSHNLDNGTEDPVDLPLNHSTVEKNYAQQDKEKLATVYSVRYFYHYLLGHKLMIYSDYKLLPI